MLEQQISLSSLEQKLAGWLAGALGETPGQPP